MKKRLSLLLALFVIFSLVSCTGNCGKETLPPDTDESIHETTADTESETIAETTPETDPETKVETSGFVSGPTTADSECLVGLTTNANVSATMRYDYQELAYVLGDGGNLHWTVEPEQVVLELVGSAAMNYHFGDTTDSTWTVTYSVDGGEAKAATVYTEVWPGTTKIQSLTVDVSDMPILDYNWPTDALTDYKLGVVTVAISGDGVDYTFCVYILNNVWGQSVGLGAIGEAGVDAGLAHVKVSTMKGMVLPKIDR